ncbi:hypothetical protein ACZ90_56155 [Streptomyces albus subsp. albus]|nr:hypothetical protein ACZ90_56155 [Streptomyces albus subsp. albus]
MFRRTFWFSTGVAAGVWATAKVNRKLSKLTPESLAAQAADRAVLAGRRVKLFALDVRDGMADREAALRDALGLTAPPDADQPRELAAGPPVSHHHPQGSELPASHPQLIQTYPANHRTTGKEDH